MLNFGSVDFWVKTAVFRGKLVSQNLMNMMDSYGTTMGSRPLFLSFETFPYAPDQQKGNLGNFKPKWSKLLPPSPILSRSFQTLLVRFGDVLFHWFMSRLSDILGGYWWLLMFLAMATWPFSLLATCGTLSKSLNAKILGQISALEVDLIHWNESPIKSEIHHILQPWDWFISCFEDLKIPNHS